MDSHRHVVANTEYRTEGVRARTKVGNGAQILHAQSLLLQGIFLGVCRAIHLQLGQLNLHRLTGTLALHQRTRSRDTRTRGNGLQLLFREVSKVNHNLYILDGRAVVQRNE